MASRNSYRRRSARQSGGSRRLNSVQWAGITLAILAVIGVAWALWAGRTGNPSNGPAAGALSGPLGTNAPVPANLKQWPAAPAMTIDPSKTYYANITMAKGGTIVIQLFADKAPITVNSFVFLANQGFYNGTTFHRVIDGFMAQGGDPTGTGSGGPGYTFKNEQNDLAFDKAGVVAMANSGPDTNGSQFFITFGPVSLQESNYTIFGQVIGGMDVVNGITRRDPSSNPPPDFTGDVMQTVTITSQ
jgi:peptidylprolyl isomerase